MKTLTLKATTRDVLGKNTRFLRRKGIIPTHLFGHKLKSMSLECKTEELNDILSRAGTTTLLNLNVDAEKHPRKVLVREIQKDVFGKEILHVDFYQVKMTEKIKADIPIVLVGEAPALKSKGRLLAHPLNTLSIECLPDHLLHEVTVDISSLEEVDQAIHVKDLKLSADITVNNDPAELIVKISEAAVAKAEEFAEAEEAEGAAEGATAEASGSAD